MDIEELQIIYSLWSGYLDKPYNYWNKYRENIIQLHTSGHADSKFLKQLVKEVNPAKIIPIHTACPNMYLELFGDKVISFEDGKTIDLKKNLLQA
jgi:ribonuclease J